MSRSPQQPLRPGLHEDRHGDAALGAAVCVCVWGGCLQTKAKELEGATLHGMEASSAHTTDKPSAYGESHGWFWRVTRVIWGWRMLGLEL